MGPFLGPPPWRRLGRFGGLLDRLSPGSGPPWTTSGLPWGLFRHPGATSGASRAISERWHQG
eukprot:4869489-Pyramimonas_sp.AAC.1